MHSLIGRLADYCVEKQIISRDKAAWFIYGLEKRLSTVLVGIPFLLLAVVISNISCAISFFVSYFFLRQYIGGFHANSILACLLFSLLCELVFFSLVYPLLSTLVIFCFILVCVAVIYMLAPYNHPNMHLTDLEIIACKKKGRLRILTLVAIIVTAGILGLDEVAKGLTLGIALASVLLCLGYIFDRRITI